MLSVLTQRTSIGGSWRSSGPTIDGRPVRKPIRSGLERSKRCTMALCPEGCTPGSGGDSSGSEAGSSCLQFGVRSYLHHFYEECSSSMWERDPENRGSTHSQTSTLRWNSAVWKVSLALGVLMLTAGIVSLSVAYSTPHKIESFGEGDLYFVDPQAISYNRGLHLSTASGIGLSCLGSALAVMGVVVWVLPKANLKERLLHRSREADQRGEAGSKWRGFKDGADVITKPPDTEEGKIPFILAKVKNVQPPS
ncbi:neurensin 1-like [Fundulus diaphanus]